MAYDPERIVNIGELEKRGKTVCFGIKEKDRSRHIYVIGQTGTGKSTLLEMLAMQDIRNGTGLIFMDPHGQSVEALLNYVTHEHMDKIIYFAPQHQEKPIGLNIMEDIGYDKRHLVVSSLMASFEKIWGAGTWSDRMAYILQNTLLALIEYPDTTLLDVGRMYSSKDFREKVVANLKDPQVRKYWVEEFANYTERYAQEATPSIQNKLGQFTSNPLMRNIIGQKESAFNFRELMDEGKILLVNLSKGQIGENNARMLGVLFTTKIYLAALSRSDMTKAELEAANPCNFFVDEFQSFANSSFSDILSEARKYKLNLIMAHQYLGQLYSDDSGSGDAIRDAVFGNVGTFVSFRVGPVDAEIIAKQFAPDIMEEDLVALPRYHIYLTLNIDGAGSMPFSARTFYEPAPENESLEQEVIQRTMDTYGVDREIVEKLVEDNLAEDARASEAEKKGGQKGGKQQGWGKKSGGGGNAKGGQKQQGGQKGEENHMPLKGLLQQAIQQQGTAKPKKQIERSTENKKVTERQKAMPVSMLKTEGESKEVGQEKGEEQDEKQKKPLLGKLFTRKSATQEETGEKTDRDTAPPAAREQQPPVKQVQTKTPPQRPEQERDKQGAEHRQQRQKPNREQDPKPPARDEPQMRNPKSQKPVRRGQGRQEEQAPKEITQKHTQNNNTERPRRPRARRTDQREKTTTRHAKQQERSHELQQKSREVARGEKNSPQGQKKQHERRRRSGEKNTKQQNTPQKSTIPATRQKKNKSAKIHEKSDTPNRQEKSREHAPQQRAEKQPQPASQAQRLPSGVLTGTVSRSMATQQNAENKQQETPQQQNRPQPINTNGGLGDLVKSAKASGLRKDLKVAPKKEKQAPPVSYEEGWVAIGDLSKVPE